ncbi:DUF2637 domain-containing protein [Streptomyces sp. 130]|uniref:DUF2637 domain-containing protein n=1 Tax=Streptomyces sp. 130 TaxID=2591006 RepID=UPI00163D9D2E|nr:DUF2637 domain-containing protein [Streptomyces sp. 130]
MNDTLTGDQQAAPRGAMAPAAPGPAPAAPGTREAAPATTTGAPPSPRKGGPGWPGAAGGGVSTAGAARGAAPAGVAPPEATRGTRTVNWLLLAVAVLGMPTVGVIGFAASYSTLERFAFTHGFSEDLAAWFPIGVDVSIVAFLAADLVMVRRGTPWSVLRIAAHAMTLVTVLLNATDGLKTEPGQSVWDGLLANPLWAVGHAAMPVLFVIGVGAARRLLMHTARIKDGSAVDRIPLHRWVLAPSATGRLYRRMRLANVRSYPEMVQREQDLAGYEMWLRQKYKGDLKKASEIERLPMTMAPRGYTVNEALALPEKWAAQEAERKNQKTEREQAETERQRQQEKAQRIADEIRKAEEAEAKAQADARVGVAEAEAEAVQAEAEARAATAKTRAELSRTAAERLARQEADAIKSAEAAEARRAEAEADRITAEEKQRAEQARAEAARIAEETELQEQRTHRATAARIREAERLADAEERAAEAAVRAAELRAQAARIEAEIEAAEDYARLGVRQRNARRVARMLLAAHPAGTPAAAITVEAVPLATIMDRLSIGRTVASEVRAEAVTLIEQGYDGQVDATFEPQEPQG